MERIVDQVVNPKILTVFMPQVEDVVYKYLGIEKPKKGKENQTGMTFSCVLYSCVRICCFVMALGWHKGGGGDIRAGLYLVIKLLILVRLL